MNINVKKIIKNTSMVTCAGAFVLALIPGCNTSHYIFSSQNKSDFDASVTGNTYYITADDGDKYEVTREQLDKLNLPANCEEPLFLSYDENGNTLVYAVTGDILSDKDVQMEYIEKMNNPKYDKVYIRSKM